jgi:uncharacterized Zn finger protein
MKTIQEIYCPNCGSPAERQHIHTHQLIQTQCPTCDYFMVTCSDTGKVIEAYAPGISERLYAKITLQAITCVKSIA